MNTPHRPLAYVYAYALWFLSIGLGLLAAMILRETIIFALIAQDAHRYTVHMGTQASTILLSLILLILIVVLENRYRTGLKRAGRTRRYFFRFLGWVLLTMAFGHFWYAGTAWSQGTLDSFRLSAGLVEALVGVVALRLAKT